MYQIFVYLGGFVIHSKKAAIGPLLVLAARLSAAWEAAEEKRRASEVTRERAELAAEFGVADPGDAEPPALDPRWDQLKAFRSGKPAAV